MSRANRQLKIVDIISKHDIDTQEELVAYLEREGFKVTQATISRDIKDLGIIKTLSDDDRHYKYVIQKPKETSISDKFLSMYKNTVLSIKVASILVILKTEAGSAGPAAELIDKLNFEEVMGVIAGDNTIFVATDSHEHAERVKDRLKNLLDA